MPGTARTAAVMALLAAAVRPGAAPPAKPVYEVYALRYATLPGFPVSSLVAGADPARKLDIAMSVWLLKGPGRKNVLVDTGFYRAELFKDWEVRGFTKPSDVLAKVGLRPEDVSDVIITHMHWDHVGGADLFPNARVWIQKAEWEYSSDPSKKAGGVVPADVAALQKVREAGRLSLVEGDAEVIPGITVYLGGKHTYASQYVGVNTASGTVVVASDAVYLYENLAKHLSIAQSLDLKANLAAQDRMKTIASSLRLIVPGHDPEVFVRFPTPGNGVARIQ